MPNIRKIITCCLLFAVSHYFLNTATAQPFYTETQTLHSSINGKEVAKLTFSVEAKGNKYILTITNAQSASDTEIWIFPKATKADKIKSLHASLEAKGINDIFPFCSGNKVNIPISESKIIRSQEKLTLAGALAAGETVTLEMNFYIAAKTKKKSTINNHAKARISLTLPATGTGKNNDVVADGEDVTTLMIDTDLSVPVAEPTSEERETLQQQKTDSLLQIQIADLNLFISEKNTAIEALLSTLNELEKQNKKIEDSIIAPIENTMNRLREDVDIRKNSPKNSPVIAEDENLCRKFIDFSSTYTEATKKIQTLRQEPPAVNWGMYIGIAVGVLMAAGMFFMQIWNQIKIKRQQRRQQEKMKKEMNRREFETLDQNIEYI